MRAVPVIKAVMKVVATAVRVTVTSTGITTDLPVQVVVVTVADKAVVKQNHQQDQAGHMLLLTVKTDRVVTDQAVRAKVVETDQVADKAVTDPVDQVVETDQVVLVTDQLPVALTVVVPTEDQRIKKSIRTRSRIRSRKPWPK
jgi:hypothetical protein